MTACYRSVPNAGEEPRDAGLTELDVPVVDPVETSTEVDVHGEPDVRIDPIMEPEPEPIIGGTVGEPCRDEGDCAGVPGEGRTCLTHLSGYVYFPGGYCSASCTSSADCGPDSLCTDFFGFGHFCFLTCEEISDCRLHEGYECATVPGLTYELICIPPASCPGRGYDCHLHREVNPFDPIGTYIRYRLSDGDWEFIRVVP